MLSIVVAFLASTQVYAGTWRAQTERIWDTQAKKVTSLDEISKDAQPSDIFVFGEEHATKDNAQLPSTYIHHHNQVRLIEALQAQERDQYVSVSVGMEFLTYTFQNLVDQFLNGTLLEADFLKAAQWPADPFEFYRDQILAPRNGAGGRTIALNIPSAIASKVAHSGKDSLDASDLSQVPPLWERGNDAYFERFSEVMKDHVPPDALERYFWAQSLWDDTMAWKALQYHQQGNQDIMVIIVGAFHTEFGGGLPYELRKQGANVKTVIQIETDDWSDANLQQLIQDDPKYGARADYLWLHSGAIPVPLEANLGSAQPIHP